jgi:hypothetical protein
LDRIKTWHLEQVRNGRRQKAVILMESGFIGLLQRHRNKFRVVKEHNKAVTIGYTHPDHNLATDIMHKAAERNYNLRQV